MSVLFCLKTECYSHIFVCKYHSKNIQFLLDYFAMFVYNYFCISIYDKIVQEVVNMSSDPYGQQYIIRSVKKEHLYLSLCSENRKGDFVGQLLQDNKRQN